MRRSGLQRRQRRRGIHVRDEPLLFDDPGGLEDVGEHVVLDVASLFLGRLLLLLLLLVLLLSQVEDDEGRLRGLVRRLDKSVGSHLAIFT